MNSKVKRCTLRCNVCDGATTSGAVHTCAALNEVAECVASESGDLKQQKRYGNPYIYETSWLC